MTSVSDDVIYDRSISDKFDTEKFLRKEVVYIQDSNAQSYSGGQVYFDSSTTANSGKWASWSEAFFVFPLVIAYKSTLNITAVTNTGQSFICAPKSGYWNFIDSMSVDYNGTSIVQLTPYLNVFTNFKVLSTWSQDNMVKYGPSLGFWLDDATSLGYSAAASVNGIYIYNNVALGAFTSLSADAAYGYIGNAWNNGFITRARIIGNTPDAGYNAIGAYISDVASYTQVAANYYAGGNALADEDRIYFWNITAKIRLRDICDFFDKVPLLKGAFFRFTINVNTSSFTITGAVAPTQTIGAGAMSVRGRTNPIMVASAAAGNPLNRTLTQAGGASDLSFSCGIRQTTPPNGAAAVGSSQLSSCRIYLPLYTMNPVYEEQYLAMHKTKTIEYTDIYNYYISNIAAASQFNQLITNGIVNPKELLIVPYITQGAQTISQFTSPFDSAPVTTAPQAAIGNLQIQLAGVNLLQQQIQYNFDAYMNEVSKTGINGGQTTGLMSGLLTESSWELAYRYYYFNIARRREADNTVPISVLIQGTNYTSVAMDYVTFVSFGRTLTIDTVTGAVVS